MKPIFISGIYQKFESGENKGKTLFETLLTDFEYIVSNLENKKITMNEETADACFLVSVLCSKLNRMGSALAENIYYYYGRFFKNKYYFDDYYFEDFYILQIIPACAYAVVKSVNDGYFDKSLWSKVKYNIECIINMIKTQEKRWNYIYFAGKRLWMNELEYSYISYDYVCSDCHLNYAERNEPVCENYPIGSTGEVLDLWLKAVANKSLEYDENFCAMLKSFRQEPTEKRLEKMKTDLVDFLEIKYKELNPNNGIKLWGLW